MVAAGAGAALVGVTEWEAGRGCGEGGPGSPSRARAPAGESSVFEFKTKMFIGVLYRSLSNHKTHIRNH